MTPVCTTLDDDLRYHQSVAALDLRVKDSVYVDKTGSYGVAPKGCNLQCNPDEQSGNYVLSVSDAMRPHAPFDC